jgi:fused signal recognition particle receptor
VTNDLRSQRIPGFFTKLRDRLSRGKSWLGSDVGALLATRRLDAETLEALEERLVSADVGIDTTERLLDRMKSLTRAGSNPERALQEAVSELLTPLALPLEVDTSRAPYVILVLGVNGTGKTTSIGKLAHWLKQRNYSVLLAAGDTFRAAAIEQLTEWGARAGVPVVSQASGADPAAVIHDALYAAKARGVDVVIADTAGRLHTSAGLMDELKKIKRVTERFEAHAPHETLLVLDASQGQNALTQAREFHAQLDVTGLVLTKLDGTAKGGILLAIANELRLPIRFVAVGESLEDFGVFNADDFAAALTGADIA